MIATEKMGFNERKRAKLTERTGAIFVYREAG
jgi:hypothetical protein